MTSRPNVPAIFPSRQAPSSGRPLPIRRVLWGEFPDLLGTISRLRLLALPRASLRLLRSALPPLRPLRSPGVGRFPEDPDYFYRGARAASPRWRRRDLPGSWTTLGTTCPALRPRRTAVPGHSRTGDVVFRSDDQRRLRIAPFEALSRGLHALCVRFAAGVAPGPRNTRFRLVANLDRSGTLTCWVALKVSVMSIPLHGILLHQASPGATSIGSTTADVTNVEGGVARAAPSRPRSRAIAGTAPARSAPG